jgi:nitrate/nitrite transporter NarK
MISVIAAEIPTDLSLDESGLGLLSSTFFISPAVAQLPCRLALDRFGTRLNIGIFMWLAVSEQHLLTRYSSVLLER